MKKFTDNLDSYACPFFLTSCYSRLEPNLSSSTKIEKRKNKKKRLEYEECVNYEIIPAGIKIITLHTIQPNHNIFWTISFTGDSWLLDMETELSALFPKINRQTCNTYLYMINKKTGRWKYLPSLYVVKMLKKN